MRKTALTFVAAAMMLALGGVALAATVECPNRADGRCVGTKGPDTIRGTNRADEIRGLAGKDRILGDSGRDQLYGNAGDDDINAGSCSRAKVSGGDGDDFVNAKDSCSTIPENQPEPGEFRDVVGCGAGRDVVRANPDDRIAEDCEIVRRR